MRFHPHAHRFACTTAAALAVTALAATGAAPALAASPGENGKLLFDSLRDGGDNPDIFTMRPNGSNPINLTADSEAFDGRASWRADGQKIVFMSNRETPDNPTPPESEGPDLEIFVIDADGTNLRQITFNRLDDEAPAWSPNGKKIVFQKDLDFDQGEVDYDIYTMKADGTRERNLTNSPGVQDTDPDWSPDDQRLAFMSDRDGDGEIYTMKPDGSRLRQLTVNDGPLDTRPSWSPDGRKLVFDSDRDATPETAEFQVEIYTMRANGDDQTRLTFHELSDFFPAWSPDGRRIAFTSFRDATDEDPENAEIYTMRTDGSRLANRTNNPGIDIAPDWQPLDGHRGGDGHHGDD